MSLEAKRFIINIDAAANSLRAMPHVKKLPLGFMMDSVDRENPREFYHGVVLHQHAVGDSAFTAVIEGPEAKQEVFLVKTNGFPSFRGKRG